MTAADVADLAGYRTDVCRQYERSTREAGVWPGGRLVSLGKNFGIDWRDVVGVSSYASLNEAFAAALHSDTAQGKGNGGFTFGGCGKKLESIYTAQQPDEAKVTLTQVEMFPAMCTHYDIERKKQIRIESISNALNADVDANLKVSGTLFYACLKALDNAMRRESGRQETNGYKMGQFSQKNSV